MADTGSAQPQTRCREERVVKACGIHLPCSQLLRWHGASLLPAMSAVQVPHAPAHDQHRRRVGRVQRVGAVWRLWLAGPHRCAQAAPTAHWRCPQLRCVCCICCVCCAVHAAPCCSTQLSLPGFLLWPTSICTCQHLPHCSGPPIHRPSPRTAPNSSPAFSWCSRILVAPLKAVSCCPPRTTATAAGPWQQDPRLPALGLRAILPSRAAPPPVGGAQPKEVMWRAYRRWRILQGVAEGGSEIASGEASWTAGPPAAALLPHCCACTGAIYAVLSVTCVSGVAWAGRRQRGGHSPVHVWSAS